jgi:predicted transcriptional regulator
MNKLTAKVIVETLQQIGLSEVETSIYLLLLKDGPSTPLILSRKTKINRTSIYRTTEKLIQKGLVSELIESNTTKYSATDPQYLSIIYQEEKNRLSKLETSLNATIHELSAMNLEASSPVEIKHYRGLDGLKQVLWNVLKSGNEKDVLGYAREFMESHIDAEFMETWRNEICKRGMHNYELTNTPEDGHVWTANLEYVEKHYTQKYLSPKILEIHHQIWIYGDTLMYYNFENADFWAIEIINSEIALVQRQLFWIMWEKGVEMEAFVAMNNE